MNPITTYIIYRLVYWVYFMLESNFKNLGISNVQLKTDVKSKKLPKTFDETQIQNESKIWQYLSSNGNINAAVMTRPSFMGNPEKTIKKP